MCIFLIVVDVLLSFCGTRLSLELLMVLNFRSSRQNTEER